MSAFEFQEWVELFKIEPYGELRQSVGHAMTSMTIAQVNAKKGKRFKLSDFMPKFDRSPKVQSGSEIRKALLAFANAHNQKIERGRKAKQRSVPKKPKPSPHKARPDEGVRKPR